MISDNFEDDSQGEFQDDAPPANAPKRKQPNFPGYSLRLATEDDIPEILRIERAVHLAPWTEENIRTELAKPYARFLVMTDDETDEQVAGYIVYWVMFEEGHILNVAVDLPFRGRGLAKQMVRRAAGETHKKGIRKILLDVRKSNESAIGLYQSAGFVVTHVRKAFYSNGEDAFQMALFMDEAEIVQF